MLASVAFALSKRPPRILSLKVLDKDYDHVIALYKENGYWGAVSKTNHAVLGFRDPIYKTIRELALSYFHEYFLVKMEKNTTWLFSPYHHESFWDVLDNFSYESFTIAEAISEAPHTSIIPKENEKFIRHATKLERSTASISHDGK